jgi:hypothetical protein
LWLDGELGVRYTTHENEQQCNCFSHNINFLLTKVIVITINLQKIFMSGIDSIFRIRKLKKKAWTL